MLARLRIFLTTTFPMVIYFFIGLGFLFQGVRYLWAGELMPYHLDVIEMSWSGLAVKQQQLFIGLLNGFGAGSLSTGVAVILMVAGPLRRRQPWAFLITACTCLTLTGALLYVTSSALLPGAVPIMVSKIFFGLALIAAMASLYRVRD